MIIRTHLRRRRRPPNLGMNSTCLTDEGIKNYASECRKPDEAGHGWPCRPREPPLVRGQD